MPISGKRAALGQNRRCGGIFRLLQRGQGWAAHKDPRGPSAPIGVRRHRIAFKASFDALA